MSEISRMREKWRLQRGERMSIVIKISETVSEQQRQDPRFKKLLAESEAFFNDPSRCTDNFKLMLGLHEGGHAYFARRSGATNIQFYGPQMLWDSRPQYDCPAISRSATSWTPSSSAPVLDVLKANIGGYICRRELSAFPNDEIAIGMDLQGAREWFDCQQNQPVSTFSIGAGDAAFKVALEDAERAILQDLEFPFVVQDIWSEARRFVKEIFPAPN